MSHSGRFEREYFCHNCHLAYTGYWSIEEGREPCPHCASEDICAVDTIGHCYCWISGANFIGQALGKRSGRSPWRETVWWREEWMRPEWHEAYANTPRHEPDMKAVRYWQRRAGTVLRRRMQRGRAS